MKRKEFIYSCSKGCLIMLGGGITFLQNCMGSQYIAAQLSGSDIIIPLSSFQAVKENASSFRKYVIAHNEKLQYPICIYRISATEYQALLMKCTHQGTELQVFGERLQCPAHGSEFSITGAVQNGPAESPLRTFPVKIENETLKINLA